MFMCLVPKFLQIPFQFLEIYSLILKLLSNLWKLMLTSIFRLILLFEFLTLEYIAYECRTTSKCLKGFGLLNQPAKQEPKFQLIGSQLQQCKKSTELTSNILKNGIIFVSVSLTHQQRVFLPPSFKVCKGQDRVKSPDFFKILIYSLTWLGFIIAPLRYQNIPLGIKKFPPTENAP